MAMSACSCAIPAPAGPATTRQRNLLRSRLPHSRSAAGASADRAGDGLGGDRFRPPKILMELVEAGHLGQKTGQGFHTYPREPGTR